MLLEGNKYQEKSNNVRFHANKHLINHFAGRKKESKVNNGDFRFYAFICIIYLIGIILGGIYFRLSINNEEIKRDITEKISMIGSEVQTEDVLSKSTVKNLEILIIFWIVGASAIGSPFLILLCMYKGVKIAFTVSAILMKFGFVTGNIFVFQKMFLYSFVKLLAMMILTVSSMKVSRNIFVNKKDIKLEIVRHSMVAILCTFLLIASIFLETFVTL
ncbi:MAG: stage II sporulation protein M [Clostridia bacterium]|nr:stage II sporulation protein M [Clostridia bacterium]